MNAAELKAKFAEIYGEGGDLREYFAPGRVNLIGEHTDYNGGHVFPCALTIGTYGVARKRDDDKIHFYSANIEGSPVVEVSLADITYKKSYGWANYPLGVVWAFAEREKTLDKGFDMAIWGNIPNGSRPFIFCFIGVLTGVILRDLYGFDDYHRLTWP